MNVRTRQTIVIMKVRSTPYLLLAALACILWAPAAVHAQQFETKYFIPPALTGSNGRALVGTQSGKIYRAITGITGKLTLDTSAPSLEIPSEVRSVWALSIPNPKTTPDLVVGLISYDTGAAAHYGIIRSTDFGTTWTLQKPDAFLSSAFPVLNDWVTQPLADIIWLEDGMHGWAYGRTGIVRTTDAGLTWEMMRADGADVANIWALEFKSPTEGVAAIGGRGEQKFNSTTDGGRTWTVENTSTLLPLRAVHIDYVGGEYRMLAYDRFQTQRNGFIYTSTDGMDWGSSLVRRDISIVREQTSMSEIFWADSAVGFIVLRSGDIFRNTEATRRVSWINIQPADSVAYPVNPNAGWGQRSILLDNSSIVHVSTNSKTGAINRFEQWLVQLSAAPEDSHAPTGRSISIAPNPAMGTAVVQLELLRPSALAISIIDPLGRRILRKDLPGVAAGSLRFGLDISGLSAGAYRVVVTTEGGIISSPLLVVE